MYGMNKTTGKPLEGLDHLKQSIIDILTTPVGSRVMRREYGSKLFELVDTPTTEDFAIQLYAATAEALQEWEHRFRLENVKIESISDNGKVTLSLRGIYLPDGKPIRLDGISV
tara:strand:- start:2248 stop:2586 length:339 start_codon:yes stop_codon:yes gene_type:complete